MTLWLDAHLSPHLVPWIQENIGIAVLHIRELNLIEAEDSQVFFSARQEDAIVVTNDRDFVELLNRLGPPPRIIWCTCGNTSNDCLRAIFSETLADALNLLNRGESLVEISDAD